MKRSHKIIRENVNGYLLNSRKYKYKITQADIDGEGNEAERLYKDFSSV